MENLKGYQTVAPFNQFSSDFQNYVKQNNLKVFDSSNCEVLVATPSLLNNTETSKLNRQAFNDLLNKMDEFEELEN